MALEDLLISVRDLIEKLGIVSIIAIMIIIIILIVLIKIEKKLLKRIILKGDRNTFYLKRIEEIDKKNQEDISNSIDKIAIDFFKERFGIKRIIEYSELKLFFEKQKNKEAAEFCSLMNNALYSINNVNKKTNQKLVKDLSNIIKNNPFPNKEKKIQKSNNFMERIKDLKEKIQKKKLERKIK